MTRDLSGGETTSSLWEHKEHSFKARLAYWERSGSNLIVHTGYSGTGGRLSCELKSVAGALGGAVSSQSITWSTVKGVRLVTGQHAIARYSWLKKWGVPQCNVGRAEPVTWKAPSAVLIRAPWTHDCSRTGKPASLNLNFSKPPCLCWSCSHFVEHSFFFFFFPSGDFLIIF